MYGYKFFMLPRVCFKSIGHRLSACSGEDNSDELMSHLLYMKYSDGLEYICINMLHACYFSLFLSVLRPYHNNNNSSSVTASFHHK